MKTTLLLGAMLSLLTIPAQAKGPRGGGPGGGNGERALRSHPASGSGRQLASGLQTSGPLELATLSPRLSEEDWRKIFIRKDPRQ